MHPLNKWEVWALSRCSRILKTIILQTTFNMTNVSNFQQFLSGSYLKPYNYCFGKKRNKWQQREINFKSFLGRTLKQKFFRENLFKRKIYSYLFVGNIGRSSIWMMERIFCSFWLLLNLKILQGTLWE